MATDSRAWVNDQAWRCGSIGGDTRYWGPGSWALYLWGTACLDNDRKYGLLNQYSTRIDYFAFGILALEVQIKNQRMISQNILQKQMFDFLFMKVIMLLCQFVLIFCMEKCLFSSCSSTFKRRATTRISNAPANASSTIGC